MEEANNLLVDSEGASAIDTCGTLAKCKGTGYCGYQAAEGYAESGHTDCYFNEQNPSESTNEKCY